MTAFFIAWRGDEDILIALTFDLGTYCGDTRGCLALKKQWIKSTSWRICFRANDDVAIISKARGCREVGDGLVWTAVVDEVEAFGLYAS